MATYQPGEQNITLYQGADFTLTATLAFNISGASFAAKCLPDFNQISGAPFVVTTVPPLSAGTIIISMPKETIATLNVGTNATQRLVNYGYWDCEMSLAGETSRILQGQVSISKEATK